MGPGAVRWGCRPAAPFMSRAPLLEEKINHCPLWGEEGAMNKVAFGWAWKLLPQAPSSLCGNQWAFNPRPVPWGNVGFSQQWPQPPAWGSGTANRARGGRRGPAGRGPCCWPFPCWWLAFCAFPVTAALACPGDSLRGQDQHVEGRVCPGPCLQTPQMPHPVLPPSLPAIFLVVVTACSWPRPVGVQRGYSWGPRRAGATALG